MHLDKIVERELLAAQQKTAQRAATDKRTSLKSKFDSVVASAQPAPKRQRPIVLPTTEEFVSIGRAAMQADFSLCGCDHHTLTVERGDTLTAAVVWRDR